MKEIRDGDWDLFLRVTSDHCLVVQAVAVSPGPLPLISLQLTSHLECGQPSSHTYQTVHFDAYTKLPYNFPFPSLIDTIWITFWPCGILLSTSSPPLNSYHCTPSLFFDAQPTGIKRIAVQELDNYDGNDSTKIIKLQANTGWERSGNSTKVGR